MADDAAAGWEPASPAEPADIAEVAAKAPFPLPAEYLEFLSRSNGGEGELGADPGWFVLWRAEQVLSLNRSYHVPEELPGFFGIGSNGGGELLAFDSRSGMPYPVVAVPFIPMEAQESLIVAETFGRFTELMGKTWQE